MVKKKFLKLFFNSLVYFALFISVTVHSFLLPQKKSLQDSYIVIVKESNIAAYDSAVEGFKEILTKEKVQVNLKIYDQKDKYLFNKINDIKPALIITLGSTTTKTVHSQIKNIPIIYAMVVDPEGSNIKKLGLKGVTVDIPAELQLKTLKMSLPSIKNISVIYHPSENKTLIANATSIAQLLGFTLKTFPVNTEADIPCPNTLSTDLLWIIPDTIVCKPVIVSRLIQVGLKKHFAVMGFTRSYAKAGAVISLTCDYKDNGRQAGELALKILKNENKSIPSLTFPRNVKIYLNITAANILDLKILESTIQNADEVF